MERQTEKHDSEITGRDGRKGMGIVMRIRMIGERTFGGALAWGTAGIVATSLTPIAAMSQTSAPISQAYEADGNPEIGVAAHKRSESVQKVPESIRAITAQEKEKG